MYVYDVNIFLHNVHTAVPLYLLRQVEVFSNEYKVLSGMYDLPYRRKQRAHPNDAVLGQSVFMSTCYHLMTVLVVDVEQYIKIAST